MPEGALGLGVLTGGGEPGFGEDIKADVAAHLGTAIGKTAQLKNGDATACVAPQHAGCTGQVETVTTVFSA